MLLGEIECLNVLFEQSLKYFVDSPFYKDKNNDGVIHIPLLYGDDFCF